MMIYALLCVVVVVVVVDGVVVDGDVDDCVDFVVCVVLS